jgi:hypothetical protein
MKKIPCIKETRPDVSGGWCIWRLNKSGQLADMFAGAEVGDKVVLEFCEMIEDEIDALPEFAGW